MIDKLQEIVHLNMSKCINKFKNNINSIRTNRVNSDFLKGIYVDYYGIKTALSQLSSIVMENNSTLKVTIFDISIKKNVEKAILKSNLGLNPVSTNTVIRIPIPGLTEDRRKELIKIIRSEAEQARIFIRNIRREANEKLKVFLKNKDISKDIERIKKISIQKNTNIFIKKIDNLTLKKEKDLMIV